VREDYPGKYPRAHPTYRRRYSGRRPERSFLSFLATRWVLWAYVIALTGFLVDRCNRWVG
jgi:hypothetical protein